ncbi:MAG TPA: acyltransferase [Rhodoblastus sp.]|nr:acyltransferase [Rhodoblastus sp.]
MNQQTSRFVNAARGLAAVAVLFTHVHGAVLVNVVDTPQALRGLLVYIAWFLYGFAHQAVVVFFVLSGFLIGGGVLGQAARGKRFLSRYLVDRTARIYLVLIPALVLTAALDALGRKYFGATGIYDLPIYSDRSGLGVFMANLAGLQDIYAPYFGTDSALWTLSHEYWYYVAFGLFGASLSAGYSPRARRCALFAAVGVTAIMSATLSYHLFGFGLWLLGAAAARLGRPLMRSARNAAWLFVVVAVGLRLGLRYSLIEIWWIGGLADAAVALAFANVLLALRFDASPLWRFSRWSGHAALSDVSYSLYAIHMPVVVFLCAAAQTWFGFGWRSIPAGLPQWVLFVGVLATTMLFARLFWRLFEANTPAVRAAAHRLMERWASQAAAPAGMERARR